MKAMKHVLTGVAVAALIAFAMPGSAQARMHHQGCWHYSWHGGYGPYAWGPAHAANDFVANRLNRQQLGGAVELNPQPLPPR
jgi:hypothetical protein